MKKKWLVFLTAAFALTTAFGFATCKDGGKGDNENGEKTEIEQIYDQYVIYAEAKGQAPLSYEEWLETIKGADGKDGVGISSVTVNEDGALVITFTDGTSQTVDMPVNEQLRYQKISGKEEYRVMGMGTVSDLDIVIPATYRGLPVTEIGADAFKEEYYITSVTIGENVTTIGGNAFNCCDSLTSLVIPDSVTTIGENAFYDCDSLTSVTIGDSVTTIGEKAFYDCDGLTSVTIPDSVTTIGNFAFSLWDGAKNNLESI